ncbi:MAG: LytTR family DNA-binding domain-containing protein [Bacteroidota bacterium]
MEENKTVTPEKFVDHLILLPETLQLRSFNSGIVDVRMLDIIRVEAKKSYSIFHIEKSQPFISSHNLSFNNKLLNPKYFFRVNKSCILNFFQVEEVIKTNPIKVVMKDNSEIIISRRRAIHFMAMYKLFLYDITRTE